MRGPNVDSLLGQPRLESSGDSGYILYGGTGKVRPDSAKLTKRLFSERKTNGQPVKSWQGPKIRASEGRGSGEGRNSRFQPEKAGGGSSI